MPGTSEEVEQYVKEYGEHYRGFIENVLGFLDANETGWEPIDRSKYIEDLLQFSAGGY